MANAQYAKALRERGYLTETEWRARSDAASAVPGTGRGHRDATSIPDALTKLETLRQQGVLTSEEFQRAKEKLLS